MYIYYVFGKALLCSEVPVLLDRIDILPFTIIAEKSYAFQITRNCALISRPHLMGGFRAIGTQIKENKI